MIKERLEIGLIYLGISTTVVLLCLTIIFGIWYPDVMPSLFGLNKTLSIFTISNVIIFPALSALICKEDKKEQQRDLTILAIIQILGSGVMFYLLFQMRPLWLALVVDSFEIIRVKDIQPDERPHSDLANIKPFDHYKIVGASFSNDPELGKKQKNDDLLGISVARYPSAIVPLSEKTIMLEKYARPVAQLEEYNSKSEVMTILKEYPQATSYFPLKGYVKDGAVLANKDFTWFQPVNLWPWEDDSLLSISSPTLKDEDSDQL